MKINELYEATYDEKKAYINSTSTSVEIDKISETLSKYKNEISLAVKCFRNGDSIQRGLNTELATSNMLLVDPSKTERKAANTENYFNLLLSEILPSWKNYPKRSKSVIATTNPDSAGMYGRRYFVFPFGNPQIAIAPKGDLWACFGAISPPDLNQFMHEFCTEHNILLNGDNAQSVINAFNQVSSIVKSKKNEKPDMYDDEIYQFLASDDIMTKLNKALSPDINSFKLKSLSDLNTFRLIKNELWFSEKAILLSADVASKVINEAF